MIPEIQERLGSQHIYCQVCEKEYEGLSVISVHNLRRHQYAPETYGERHYIDRECRSCGTEGYFAAVDSEGGIGDTKLLVCFDCGTIQ